MQAKVLFSLLFVYFMHISLLLVTFSYTKATKSKFSTRFHYTKAVFKTKDKRDVKKQNITLILLLITK